MKYLMVLVFLVMAFTLYGEDFPIMLNLKSEVKIPDDFRDGIEEALTSMGYSLVDESAQQEALKENAKARNSECYDDECLVDTGKMLAARALISVEVDKKNDKLYKFKGRYIDFETGTTTKSKVMYYEAKLDDYKALSAFGKKFSNLLLGGKIKKNDSVSVAVNKDSKAETEGVKVKKEKEKGKADSSPGLKADNKDDVKKKTEKKVENLLHVSGRYSGNWDITIALQFGGSSFFKESYNDRDKFEEDLDLSLGGGGFALGATYHFKPWLAFYFDATYLRHQGAAYRDFINHDNNNQRESYEIPDLIMHSLFLTLGGIYSIGDTEGDGLVYYFKAGFSFGKNEFEEILPDNVNEEDKQLSEYYWDAYGTTSLGISLEAGINILFNKNNGIDVYMALYYAGLLDDDLGSEPYFLKLNSGETASILLGVRYNLFTF